MLNVTNPLSSIYVRAIFLLANLIAKYQYFIPEEIPVHPDLDHLMIEVIGGQGHLLGHHNICPLLIPMLLKGQQGCTGMLQV